MVALYVFSTPIGVVIGIALHGSYQENAPNTLIATGVLDSISAGILISDALLNIMGPHFQSVAYKNAPKTAKVMQVAGFWLGSGIMAYIGKYA